MITGGMTTTIKATMTMTGMTTTIMKAMTGMATAIMTTTTGMITTVTTTTPTTSGARAAGTW